MKYGNKYVTDYNYTVGTKTYECTKKMEDLFTLNEQNIDKSIAYTFCTDSKFNQFTTSYSDKTCILDTSVQITEGTRTYSSIKTQNIKTGNFTKFPAIIYYEGTGGNNNALYTSSYNDDKTAVSYSNNGNKTRFIKDVPFNHMLFSGTFSGIELIGTPVNYGRTTTGITLQQLIDNPDKYIINDTTFTGSLWTGSAWSGNIKLALIALENSNVFMYDLKSVLSASTSPSVNMQTGAVTGSKTYEYLNFKDNADFGNNIDFTFKLKDSSQYERTSGSHTYYEFVEDDTSYTVLECTYNISNNLITSMTLKPRKYLKGSHVLRLLAGFGVYCLTDGTSVNITPDNINNQSNIVLGEMNEERQTTGKFLAGADLIRSKSPNKTSSTNDDDFNPYKSASGDRIDEILINKDRYMSSGMIKYYAVDNFELLEIVEKLSEGKSIIDFKNYSDYIISCNVLPFDISTYFTCLDSTLKISDLTVGTYKRVDNILHCFDLGDYYVTENHGNFLDYEPYTTVSVHIPYCADIIVPTNLCMGRSIQVSLIVNVVTGVCRAVLSIDNTIYTTSTGNISTAFPLSIESSGTIHAGILQTASSGIASVISGATGNFTGAVIGTVNTMQSVCTANSITPKVITGGGDASTNIMLSDLCTIYISTPSENLPKGYAHTYGYACNKSGTVNSFSGYTVFKNVDISTTGTNTENEMIKNLMESGVYI